MIPGDEWKTECVGDAPTAEDLQKYCTLRATLLVTLNGWGGFSPALICRLSPNRQFAEVSFSGPRELYGLCAPPTWVRIADVRVLDILGYPETKQEKETTTRTNEGN